MNRVLVALLLSLLAVPAHAGIVCKGFDPCAGGGVDGASDIDFTGAVSVLDANFTIKDDGDTSKGFKISVGGITAGQTRTMIVPDADFTVPTNTLNNLGTTSINAALLFQTGVDVGSTAAPPRNLRFYGSGTFGSHSFTLGGTPTNHRTVTFEDSTQTVATTNTTQSITGAKAFSLATFGFENHGLASDASFCFGTNCNNSDNLARILWSTTQTPDGFRVETGALSNSVNFNERSDRTFDFQNGPCGTSACTNPTLIGRSATQDTGEWWSLTHDTKQAVLQGGNGTSANGWISTGGTVALTGGVAATVVTIPVANGAGTGGAIIYSVFASDATDHQVRSGRVQFQVVNKSDTETCVVSASDATPSETEDGSSIAQSSASTLTYSWATVAGSNACAIQITAASGLSETTLRIDYTVIMNGPGTPVGG